MGAHSTKASFVGKLLLLLVDKVAPIKASSVWRSNTSTRCSVRWAAAGAAITL